MMKKRFQLGPSHPIKHSNSPHPVSVTHLDIPQKVVLRRIYALNEKRVSRVTQVLLEKPLHSPPWRPAVFGDPNTEFATGVVSGSRGVVENPVLADFEPGTHENE